MNLKLQDEVAFWSEYQNEPLPEDLGSEEQFSMDLIIHKLNGRKMREVPVGCNNISMFIDVQKNLLLYMVRVWEDDFTLLENLYPRPIFCRNGRPGDVYRFGDVNPNAFAFGGAPHRRI